VGYEIEHNINSEWTIRQNARYVRMSLDEDYVLGAGGLTGSALSRYRFAHSTDVNQFQVDTQLAGEVTTGPLNHSLLFGFDYRNYNIDQVQASAFPSTGIDVLNPVYGLPIAALGTPYISNVINMRQSGVYGQDQIRFDRVIATLNARYDWVNTEIDNRIGASSELDQGVFTGRVGLGYEFDNGITPYVSYATSFNPVIDTDGAGRLFDAERGRQVEAGIKYEPTFMDGLITASVFNIQRENNRAPSGVPGISVPVGTVDLTGVELEANVKVQDFTVTGALTYLEAEVTSATGTTPVGNTPTRIPTLTASLGVDYTFDDGAFEGLTLGGGVRFVGGSWADEANTLRTSDATLFDARLRYEKDDWNVTLAASNIFDTSYVAGCTGTSSCGYGPGRAVTLSVGKKW